MRAWAITAVFFGHLGVRFFVGGGVGVDLFFALSGFLITHLLLREYDRRGTIDLLAFYRRRAWRLLPALVLMLLLVDLATWIHDPPGSGLLKANLIGSVWTLGFVANWTHEWIGSYIHLWSLGIEEQFYIFWAPILILLTPWMNRMTAARVLVGLAACDLILKAWLYLGGYVSIGDLHNATYSHIYGLLVGSALALALTRDGRITVPDWSRWLALLSLPAIALLTLSLPIHFSPGFAVAGLNPIFTAACGVLVGGVVIGGGQWTAVLRLPPVIWLGRISYSLYLWHLPIFVAIDYSEWAQAHRIASGLIKIALSITAAALSFHLVERPLLRRFAARDSTAVKGGVAPAPPPFFSLDHSQ